MLHMKPNFLEGIMETMRHIYGPDFEFTAKGKYKEMGSRIKKGYWEQRGNLVIQGVSDYSNFEKSACETVNRCKMLSLLKLESFGFDKMHCVEALEHCKGNVDDAIQLLYKLYFPEVATTASSQSTDVTAEELLDSRQGEKDALESIFDKAFEEKESNQYWLLKFKIDYLLVHSESERKKQAQLEKERRKMASAPAKKNVAECRNFVANGKCKYGDRCKFLHTIKKTVMRLDAEADPNWFFLEIRFPKDSRYPYEAPIVAFKTTVPDFPSIICLRVTRRLLSEAITVAQDGMPSVYAIADLLQNQNEIMEFLKNDRSTFLNPKVSIFYVPEELEAVNSTRKKLPSHYAKGNVC